MEEKKERFNAAEFAQTKAKEMAEKFATKDEPAIEETEETQEESPEVEQAEEVSQPVEEQTEESEPEVVSDEVAALKKELARVKGKLRDRPEVEEATVDMNLTEIVPTTLGAKSTVITPAEARLFTAWRDEALEELIEENPQYLTNPNAWKQFEAEYKDRIPELEYANKHKVPITKKFFKERLIRVHRAVSDDTSSERDAGKAELLKAQSAAQVMGAGSKKGEVTTPVQEARRLFPKKNDSLDSWITKKK